jgi:recombination protein RecA
MAKRGKKTPKPGNIVTTVKRDLEKLGLPVQLGSEITKVMKFVSSGSLSLNFAIGRPGYPCGLITEIVGPPNSGKSLLTLIAESIVTRRKQYVIHIDNEDNHGTKETNEWRSVFGIDNDYVIQIPPEYAEKVMEGTRKALRTLGDKCALVVVDSINAFVPERVIDKEMGEATVAVNAKLLHEWFDKLRIDNKHAAFLAINQHSSKIGGYGNPVTKGGGYAMRYDPHLSIEVKGSPIYTSESDLEGVKGYDLDIRVVKNKVGPQGRVAKCKIVYDSGGFDILDEIITMAVDRKIIKKAAAYYYIGEKNFFGREKLVDYLHEKRGTLKKLIVKLGYDPVDLGVE